MILPIAATLFAVLLLAAFCAALTFGTRGLVRLWPRPRSYGPPFGGIEGAAETIINEARLLRHSPRSVPIATWSRYYAEQMLKDASEDSRGKR